jgi:uncharacterized heparinase superfamily protein
MASLRNTIPDNLLIARGGTAAIDDPHPASKLRRGLRDVAWYQRRLAAMSAPEVAYRLGEQFKRAISRHNGARRKIIDEDAKTLVRLPVAAQCFADFADGSALISHWRDVASRVAAGQIRLLGATWPIVESSQRWHMDPVRGRSWPADTYCFDIPYRRADHYGDVKYVWELNRLQHLQPIAALAALERDRDLARLCGREIESWIEANPPYHGVNWASGIELALRVVSMLVVVSLLESAGLLTVDRARLTHTFADHGYWLRRFPSRFSSANNHCIAEAGALYCLGKLVPGLAGSSGWVDFGRRTLMAEVTRQIHPDGVGAEQSPTYTAFTLEWLLLCGGLARRLGEPFPESYWQRIAAAGEFLSWIIDAGGDHPRFGDDDEGHVIWSHVAPERYVASILASVAATLDRPDLAPPSSPSNPGQAVSGEKPAGGCGPMGVRHFSAGGYTIARAMHSGTRSLIVLDHGPLGHLSIAAHGHADALAIWLHLDDQPVLVDAGTYLYHAAGDWRAHFRSTAAHNTLSIAGADSSVMAGPFNWSRKAKATVRQFDGNPLRWSIEMEHDGFLAPFGVRHHRRVERIASDSYLITDLLVGRAGALPVEIGFLFHPSLAVEKRAHRWIVQRGIQPLLVMEGEGPLIGKLQEGEHTPARGWYAPHFGERMATRRLVFHGSLLAGTPFRVSFRILGGTLGHGAELQRHR